MAIAANGAITKIGTRKRDEFGRAIEKNKIKRGRNCRIYFTKLGFRLLGF